MLRDRKDYPRFYTPRGVAIYPAINEPDYKFKKEGEFHVRLRLPPDAPGLDAIREAADALIDEAYEAKKAELTRDKKGALLKELKKAANPVRAEIDQETAEETGYVILRASLKYLVEIKNGPKAGTSFFKRPDVFNAAGKQLKNPPKIGNGSELKMSIVPMEYFMAKDKEIGVRFELEAVQVFVARDDGGSRGADFYGFTPEDGDDIDDVEGETKDGGFSDETTAGAGRDF